MRKVSVLLFIIAVSPLLGGLYGIIHDQLTYTICPEYYTKFKFYQFGLATAGDEALFSWPRLAVAKVGFMATWWVGLPIGIVLGLLSLIFPDYKQMRQNALKAILLTMGIALVFGLFGLWYGAAVLAERGVDWWLPENLIDRQGFIMVGSMHNFSYAGGLAGLIIAVGYLLWLRFKKA